MPTQFDTWNFFKIKASQRLEILCIDEIKLGSHWKNDNFSFLIINNGTKFFVCHARVIKFCGSVIKIRICASAVHIESKNIGLVEFIHSSAHHWHDTFQHSIFEMAFGIEWKLLAIVFLSVVNNQSFVVSYALQTLFDSIILESICIIDFLDSIAHSQTYLMFF